ncbi:MAG TPA: nucleotidyltransferase domain-containing protein [Nocardioides sp.]|uniref:nucleotidyltransferase domain-containing protein n=1 Tax=Nocardioides sp. TaxID=35761 RepID=UPI002E3442BB|nr:nucleotidyltransferase domain-containing protein [Nocardioides sp.]HEX5089232.1 nucleotidyltransferase domain-containing protein [Nocardioides sp.]
MQLTEAIAPLEDGYAELLAAVAELLREDEQVRALWVSGSVARGTADAGSDLDVVVTVRDPAPFTDPSAWSSLDPVITEPIPGRAASFALTVRSGLRIDVVVEGVEELAATPYRHRVEVFDRDGLVVPDPPADGGGPDPAAMGAVVTEFLRQAAIFPAAVVAREDWLLGQVAVHNYSVLLFRLFAESNRPLPPMGVKQWSARLTEPQREVLAALPQPRATREDVVAAMIAVRDALITHGRVAVESVGGTWPDGIEAAVAAYWRRHELPWG